MHWDLRLESDHKNTRKGPALGAARGRQHHHRVLRILRGPPSLPSHPAPKSNTTLPPADTWRGRSDTHGGPGWVEI